MALSFHGFGNEKYRERPLEDVFECVMPYLSSVDRAALRSVCTPLRDLANGTCTRVALSSPPVFHALAASQLLKKFPRVNFLEFLFSSPTEVKAATLLMLTSQSDQCGQLARLKFSENRTAAQQLHQQQQQLGGYGHESRFQQYGYSSGARASPQTFDFTEALLAAICCCPSTRAVSVDKTVLLESEAAALARLPGLRELRLATNSSAQPLRRPLLQLMLSSLTALRVLKLSYIRDTTAEMALSLPRLPHLTKLTFQYAYWGDSGAGERIMAALAKHQKQLAELHLYESSVNDDMLRFIMGITSLRRLHIQDENDEEESCPTNKGLARITQLRRLEQLELFGEELQLDSELVGLLAQLPVLRHLAMAGLDSLQADDADSPAAGGAAFEELYGEVEDMDLSSTMDGDEETEESFSCASLGGDEATSRPQPASTPRSACRLVSAPSDNCSGPTVRNEGLLRPLQPPAAAAPQPQAHGSQHQGRLQQQHQQHQQVMQQTPGIGRCIGSGYAAAATAATAATAAAAAPLQVFRRLSTLRLYGPSSLSVSPPPLALLLPQPQLRHLKLSACASHANMRALAAQSGLQKLIVSHTAVPQLYPSSAPAHGHGRGQDVHEHLPAVVFPATSVNARSAAGGHAAVGMGFVAPGTAGSEASGAGAAAAAPALPAPAPYGASILGFHSEVLTGGLTSLRVLRIKDLPGLMDVHLADLSVVLSRLPELKELKLRALGMVTDAGVATLAAVTQLRRLKLYALGDGVTEAGIAHVAASLPLLEELKVKDCRRVGPMLRAAVAAYRAATAAAAAAATGSGSSGGSSSGASAAPCGAVSSSASGHHQHHQHTPLIVRCGQVECDGARCANR